MRSFIVLSVYRHGSCSDSGLSSRSGHFWDLQVRYWTQICLSSDCRVLAHGHFDQTCLLRRKEKWLHRNVHRQPVRDESKTSLRADEAGTRATTKACLSSCVCSSALQTHAASSAASMSQECTWRRMRKNAFGWPRNSMDSAMA